MSEGFIKLIKSEETLFLILNHPNAFKLLTIIAYRARREAGNPDGLLPGQCHIGDWKKTKMTEREYRTAKSILEMRRQVKIVETCRTRKKSTTGTTTRGTLVELISSTVYDININVADDRKDDRATTDRRPTDDERRTNKKEKEIKETNKEKKIKNQKIVRPPFRSSLLHEEDLNAMVAMTELGKRPVDISNFTLWVKTHGVDELEWVCSEMLSSKIIKKTPAATMQWMLTNRLYHKHINLEKNKAFAENMKKNYRLNSLIITQQYARDENTGYDFQFNWESEMFERVMCEKFDINQKTGA